MQGKIQYIFQRFCPFIAQQVGLETIIWKRINAKLEQRVIQQYKLQQMFDDEPIMRSLHDWVIGANLGDQMSIDFLEFIDSTAKDVFNKTVTRLHPKLKETLKNLLVEFDTDITLNNNPSFLNYISELTLANSILTKGDFKLLEIEQVMANGKRCDFYFGESPTLAPILIECVSIHLTPDRITSPQDLRAFLINRFNDKLTKKTIGLADNANLVTILQGSEKQETAFAIMPVLWFNHNELIKYASVFNELDGIAPFILPCCSIITVKNGRNYRFEFRTMSSIYNYFLF